MASRADELRALLTRALDLDVDEVPAFLDEVSTTHPELHEELRARLATDDEERTTADAFEATVGEHAARLVRGDRPGPGDRIGPYDITREIGEGGMGTVYLATRDGVSVCVKLLKRGMDTDALLARFRQEAEILTELDHPYIAHVEGGASTDDGLPYFVMEYIEGKEIDAYVDEERLSIRDRLRLFLKVCEAVQYAHQRLVVHRDLKPANILVTRDGTPKLLDFGIAKLLAPDGERMTTQLTTEGRLLTPEYASPEQVRGERVTTATDEYSLGVLLYRLLTGAMPYDVSAAGPAAIAPGGVRDRSPAAELAQSKTPRGPRCHSRDRAAKGARAPLRLRPRSRTRRSAPPRRGADHRSTHHRRLSREEVRAEKSGPLGAHPRRGGVGHRDVGANGSRGAGPRRDCLRARPRDGDGGTPRRGSRGVGQRHHLPGIDRETSLGLGRGSFTVSAWILTDAPSPAVRTILDKRVPPFLASRGVHLFVYDDRPGFQFSDGRPAADLDLGDVSNTFVGVTNVADGVWHHVTAVAERAASTPDGNRVVLYVDGEVDAVYGSPVPTGDVDCEAPIRVGHESDGFHVAYPFPGSIERPRFFDSALDSSRVAALYEHDRRRRRPFVAYVPSVVRAAFGDDGTTTIPLLIVSRAEAPVSYVWSIGGRQGPEEDRTAWLTRFDPTSGAIVLGPEKPWAVVPIRVWASSDPIREPTPYQVQVGNGTSGEQQLVVGLLQRSDTRSGTNGSIAELGLPVVSEDRPVSLSSRFPARERPCAGSCPWIRSVEARRCASITNESARRESFPDRRSSSRWSRPRATNRPYTR